MVEVECHTCGTVVDKPQYKIDRNDRQFCSQECYHDAGRPDMQGQSNPNSEGGKCEVICEMCGDTFQVYPYREDSARFCSRECKDDHMAGQTGEDTPRWKGAKETYICQNCGDEFEEYPYRNDQKYCSKECYREASEEIFSGDGNPVWRGGRPDYYGPNWEEQRQAALERDGHECQRCGIFESEVSRSLDVHHKKRLGWFKEEFDRPEWWERGNRLDNLTTLCASCHKKVEWSDADTVSE